MILVNYIINLNNEKYFKRLIFYINILTFTNTLLKSKWWAVFKLRVFKIQNDLLSFKAFEKKLNVICIT